MSYENSLKVLERLNNKYKNKVMNEAETRFQIIDKIIKDVFFWPETLIKVETHTHEGFSDYQLVDHRDKVHLVIEAKKEKINFNFSQYSEIKGNKVKVKILLKDDNAKQTIMQVKNYCNDIGCQYACITNGHEWAFLRTYIDGQSWQDGNAYIFNSLQDIIDNFTDINKYLTYNAIVKEFSFKQFFDGIEYSSNERYEPKLEIQAYKEQIANNHIERKLKGYFDKYFGEIKENDTELLENCYVEERGYEINFNKVTQIIEDSLSPFMKQKNIQDIDFKSDIQNHIENKKLSKVIILFGGKGSGKSTFLVSLFNSKKNKEIVQNSIVCRINLLNISNDKASIKNEIYKQLKQKLDINNILNGNIKDLIRLFNDKYTIDLKQKLSGYDTSSEIFITKRNEIIEDYKKNNMYCLERLSFYIQTKLNKAIMINIDNTDQFDQDLQDYCFSIANELSEKLNCISIISLREERYISSSIEGYLDAYEKNAFHISSPNPKDVFLKRLVFIKDKINQESKTNLEDVNILFDILITNLNNNESEFNKFMTASTHGDIRHGLNLFKSFLFSKYTNINEMISQKKWNITIHQIIKPIMIPIYRYYNEDISVLMPNIYRLRSDKNSSHFTAYRILKILSLKHNTYISIFEFFDEFNEKFNMKDDFNLNIDILLKRGLIEADNGIDKYNKDLQKIKITPFGFYLQSIIYKDFTYLELISTDLSVLDKQICNEIITLSNAEYRLILKAQNIDSNSQESKQIRYDRIQLRIKKVDKLCQYFKKQEKLEIKKYNLVNNELISDAIIKSLEQQKRNIEKSALKVLGIKQKRYVDKHGIKRLD